MYLSTYRQGADVSMYLGNNIVDKTQLFLRYLLLFLRQGNKLVSQQLARASSDYDIHLSVTFFYLRVVFSQNDDNLFVVVWLNVRFWRKKGCLAHEL